MMSEPAPTMQRAIADEKTSPESPAPRRKLISVVIPIYNEEANIRRAYTEVCKVFDAMNRYDFEILFTDNHSNDRTPQLLAEIAKADGRVRVARFARNF